MTRPRLRILHSLTLLVVLATFMAASFGAVSPQPAEAAGCGSPAIGFGRWRWCGYWYNQFQNSGDSVRIGGIPPEVNTADEFINMLTADAFGGNANHSTGAKMVMLTMIGSPLPTPQPLGSAKVVTPGQISDFVSRVEGYSDLSENGAVSYGTNGSINWSAWVHLPCGTVNTYWQPALDDIAPYYMSASNSECDIPGFMDEVIDFRDTAGNVIYRLRRLCMNPVGVTGPLATYSPTFNLTPAVSATVNGVPGTVAQVGDTIRFTYTLNNAGGTSASTTCNTYANTYPGVHAAVNPALAGGPPGPAPNPACPRTFPNGASTVVPAEIIVVATGNQTICRSLFVSPFRYGAGSTGREACVTVANQPYLKVYGGDVSAGNELKNAMGVCSNNNAAVTAWNKGSAGAYAGAGAQYAVFALNNITYFASALGNTGGAPAATGLSFRNTTTNVGAGNFGGNFGTATCIPDYYGRKPAATNTLPANVTAMNTGAYAATGATTINGGTITAGKKIAIYVNGDVFINGSGITYSGSFSAPQVPLFELVVRGNIYISGSVTRLDGVYIAQKNGATGGTIYTCATGTTPPILTNGAFYNGCTNKLTVNGAFVANSVEFLRTFGTISGATAGESSNENGVGNNAGEVFNFNPMLWMTQPSDTDGGVDKYDAIKSLPPVL